MLIIWLINQSFKNKNTIKKVIGTKFILNFSYANYYKKFWYKKRFALCKRNIENVNSKVLNTRNGRTILISKCAACKSQGQEAKRLLSSVCLKTPLSKLSNILLLGKMLLKYCSNPNLGIWGGRGEGCNFTSCWFSLNNSETLLQILGKS